ncbi:D-alanine--D-alanine ligase family protein [Miniphocaeibacter massiliensis]|uniref:D-alanine--D-alanine ligase family protein n=1 Tax=Miniphocaeibacter massiliensis TaxID=2041841 RepID=UPI000C070FBA|nr:D-alanine--D-alanine ligase [Miniphocaeibacter massiliensis]
MNIVVLAGGLSPERDVSLSSGSMVANALISNGHNVILLDLYKGLENTDNFKDAFDRYKKKEYSHITPQKEPDLEKLIFENGNRKEWLGENIINICKTADVTFLALHGAMGENGELQSVLNSCNIKYTGSDPLGSAIAMNKQISKEIFSFHKILTPPWKIYDLNSNEHFIPKLPCVIKPISGGSSIGLSLAETKSDFDKALKYGFKYEDKLLVEERIIGRELTVGVLDNKALEVAEIIPKKSIFDYESKYQDNLADEICPAKINSNLKTKLQNLSLKVHEILHLGDYSRIDFIENKNGIYCLEANILPGMTPTSVFPKSAISVGISYNDLCEKIARLALEK